MVVANAEDAHTTRVRGGAVDDNKQAATQPPPPACGLTILPSRRLQPRRIKPAPVRGHHRAPARRQRTPTRFTGPPRLTPGPAL